METYKINEEYFCFINKNNYKLLINFENHKFMIFKELEELTTKFDWKLIKEVEETLQNPNNQIEYQLPLNYSFFTNYIEKPLLSFSPNKNKLSLIYDKNKIEEYYNIYTYNNIKYYFNRDNQRYEILTEFLLGQLLEQDFEYMVDDGQTLPACLLDHEVHTLFQIFRQTQNPHNECINFKNVTFNFNNYQIEEDSTFTIKNNNFNLLEVEGCVENTLIEKTLREIFVNKKTGDESLFYDFLQRLGASFLSQNKHKFIYMLTGSGDDGKSIILFILRLMHGKLSINLKTKNLLDDFYLVNLSNTNVLLFDELTGNSFNKEVVGVLKNITGRGVVDSRIMYSQETVELQDYGIPFMATNVVPAVPFSDLAYWKRLHLIKLPNKFVDKPIEELGMNEYVLDENLEEKLAQDKNGVEWLISNSINEYRRCKGDFYIKQSALDTQFLYDGKNPIRLFIENYIVETGNINDTLSVLKIKYYLLRFCIRNNFNKKDLGVLNTRELSREIGYKIKNKFKNIEKVKRGVIMYKGLKLLLDENDEVEYTVDELKEVIKDFEEIIFE